MDETEFLAFMTFASEGGCPCCVDGDECDTPSAATNERVPPAISNAVNEHLRKRKLEEPSVFGGSKRLHIRQNRELVKREDGFSIWRLDLPLAGGDPIVEYRNSHRIVFVKQLSKASEVLSIGPGIIGSAAEENSRGLVSWEQGSAYYLPCSKGIACGWLHTLAADAKTSETADCGSATSISSTADVVVYSLKVSPQRMDEEPPEKMSCWVEKSYELFRQLAKRQPQNGDIRKRNNADNNVDVAVEGIALSDEESMTMNLITELVL